MRTCCFALLLASCFDPKLDDTPFQCGPGGVCPPDYECQSGACRRPGAGPDAPPVRIDGRIDRDAPSCDPDQFLRCKDATTAVFCLHDGQGEIEQSCGFGCDEGQGLCLQCNPAVPTSCQGDTLRRCSAVGELTTTDCAGWCEPQGSVATCVTLAPSNLPAETCLATTQVPFRTGIDVFIDTDACRDGTIVPQFSPGPFSPPSICVLVYKDVRIDPPGGFIATGQNALAIVATGSFRLDGTISVSAVGEMPGAGASRAGLGSGHDAADDPTIGGGGAGFGLPGPPEVVNEVAGPGSAYGMPQQVPLFGGSHGGRGGLPICLMCGRASPGGGGGGAVQIVACNALEVGNNAAVFASGGGGTGGSSPLQLGDGSGGGGGGSGGGILIEAETISVGNNVVATANGGGGGGGGQAGGGENGEPGSDGLGSIIPAPGGSAPTDAGDGGNGGTRGDVSPTGGQPAASGNGGKSGFGSGGSGGSAGRIRVNVRAGAPLPLPGSAVISPAPSVGPVGRNIIP